MLSTVITLSTKQHWRDLVFTSRKSVLNAFESCGAADRRRRHNAMTPELSPTSGERLKNRNTPLRRASLRTKRRDVAPPAKPRCTFSWSRRARIRIFSECRLDRRLRGRHRRPADSLVSRICRPDPAADTRLAAIWKGLFPVAAGFSLRTPLRNRRLKSASACGRPGETAG